MSVRNVAWLLAILAVATVVWIAAGTWWAVAAAGATLVLSEVVERAARRRRLSARDEAPGRIVRRTTDRDRRRP